MLRYFMAKQDAKPWLIRSVLLLQEVDFVVKDHKSTENQLMDHLFRLEDESLLELGDNHKINDMFPYEKVLPASYDLIP